MADIVNPYIAGNPVTEPTMFFGREDVFAAIRRILIGRHRDNVIILGGQRRTGKTSVLYQLGRYLGERYLCIFVDLHGLELAGLEGFLWELARHIDRSLRRNYQINLPRLDRAEFESDPRDSFESRFLNNVWSAIGHRQLLLMLDEAVRLLEQVNAGKLEQEVFSYLRHLMQHYEQLNFVFSLGSGLEEMEKEYSFLFSVGLYQKISFLNRDATIALITDPIRDYYHVEPAAIDRILQITAGHPYFTQLVCHDLFSRWQQRNMRVVQLCDVDEIVEEVMEHGLAVLKHVWDESSAGEKAIMAGMAAAAALQHKRPISPGDVNRIWRTYDVVMPAGERERAIRSLAARDVIVGVGDHERQYAFAVELQELWVVKYQPPELVKREISAAIDEWASNKDGEEGLTSVRVSLVPDTLSAAINGDTAEAVVTVENIGKDPDTFEIRLIGLLSTWYSLPPFNPSLAPRESSEEHLLIHLPKEGGANTGIYPFTVTALSQNDPRQISQAKARLAVMPSITDPPEIDVADPWAALDAAANTVDAASTTEIGRPTVPEVYTSSIGVDSRMVQWNSTDSIEVGLMPDSLRVTPFEATAEAVIVVQNSGRTVDQYGIVVDGLPADWYSLSSTTVALFPQDKEEIKFVIRPPKGSDESSGTYVFTVTVVSRADASQTKQVEGTVMLLTAEQAPERVSYGVDNARSGSIKMSISPNVLRIHPHDNAIVATITVGNNGATIDQYKIALDGLPRTWYTLSFPNVALFPGDRDTLELEIHLPEGCEARSGTYPFMVVVGSTADPSATNWVAGALEVVEFTAFDLTLSPRMITGRKGRYSVTLRNRGNVDLAMDLDAIDDKGGCHFSFQPEPSILMVGRQITMRLTIRPWRFRWVGLPMRYDFMILATPDHGEPKTVQGWFVHTPRFSRWQFVLLVLVVVAVSLFLAYSFAIR